MDAQSRKIIHIDMDAFYASVEQRDCPEYRGKPVIVGGLPNARGVVATCSYEARVFGIHSAMPSQTAYRLCPQAVFVRPRMDVYRAVSQDIMRIFHNYTDFVEPLSLDEAYLDVTAIGNERVSATMIAREIKQEIAKQTGLTASAGVSYNKLLAKMASDAQKPDGLTVITPERALAFLDRVAIGKFYGVGKVTEERLRQMGVHTGADLRGLSLEALSAAFSLRGRQLYELARAVDARPVQNDRIRQSIGKEVTLSADTDDLTQIVDVLHALAQAVASALLRRRVRGRIVVLKVKFRDFEQITRRVTVPTAMQTVDEIYACSVTLLREVVLRDKVRLLGISVQRLEPADEPQWIQLALF
ncbi:MAG: DNA polymerase IV [Firmicutes bacterium]|nr:DNA polymerase IV [Bacillota bacterium]